MKSPMRTSRTKNRGFTLTEIAIVLGIVGLILGAIWVAAAAVYNNLRVSHANTEVLQIAQGVRTIYATSSNTGTVAADLTGSMITAGVIPKDIVLNTTQAIDSWANGYTKVLTPASGDSFTIEMTDVPQSACIGLMTEVAGTVRDASLFGIGGTSASGTTISAATAGTALATAPGQSAAVTPLIATTACSSPTNNIVQFGFGLR